MFSFLSFFSFFFLLFYTNFYFITSQNIINFDYFSNSLNLVTDALGESFEYLGIKEKCPFVENPIESIKEMLPMYIRGQPQGINAIERAIAGWLSTKNSGYPTPLVLAITGPTGVGKSETAQIIAEALLAKRPSSRRNRRVQPVGFLKLRGELFSNTSEAYHTGKLIEIRRRVNREIIEHLKKCENGGIVLFDEVQKVVPGTLDDIVFGLKERGGFSRYQDDRIETYPSNGMIFITTSDIGFEKMKNLLLAYKNRSYIPQDKLRAEVKLALDAQWERLDFGRVVTEVIPFMPLEKKQIEEILSLKLIQIGYDKVGVHWASLSVDYDVIDYFSLNKFLEYDISTSNITNPKTGELLVLQKTFATYGARDVDNKGPVFDLISIIYREMAPFNPNLILHVGIEGFKPTIGDAVINPTSEDAQIVLRWCHIHYSMKRTYHREFTKDTTDRGKRIHEGWNWNPQLTGEIDQIGEIKVEKEHLENPRLCDIIWKGKLYQA